MACRLLARDLGSRVGECVFLNGWVHRLRDFGGVRFLALRDRNGLAQVVLPKTLDTGGLVCESVVRVRGTPRLEQRAPRGCELRSD